MKEKVFSKFARYLSLLTIIIFSLLTTLGSGGDDGGGGGGGGATVDNSLVSGTYRYVAIVGNGVVIGTVTFDGAGGGSESEISPSSSSSSVSYTAKTDNSITLDGSIVGTIRSGGSFIVATDTTNGNEMLLSMVKNSASLTDTQIAYRAGQYLHDTITDTIIIDVDTATPSTGELEWMEFRPTFQGMSGVDTYTFKNTSGLITVNANTVPFNSDTQLGAVSPDGQIMIIGDGTKTTDSFVLGVVGLEFPGSGMSNTSLSGTYIMHQFMDDDVPAGGSFITSRYKLIFNGNGTGTYSELATSSAGAGGSGNFTYVVYPDGSIDIDANKDGFMLADGSVIVIVDTDDSTNSLDIKVAVKQ